MVAEQAVGAAFPSRLAVGTRGSNTHAQSAPGSCCAVGRCRARSEGLPARPSLVGREGGGGSGGRGSAKGKWAASSEGGAVRRALSQVHCQPTQVLTAYHTTHNRGGVAALGRWRRRGRRHRRRLGKGECDVQGGRIGVQLRLHRVAQLAAQPIACALQQGRGMGTWLLLHPIDGTCLPPHHPQHPFAALPTHSPQQAIVPVVFTPHVWLAPAST